MNGANALASSALIDVQISFKNRQQQNSNNLNHIEYGICRIIFVHISSCYFNGSTIPLNIDEREIKYKIVSNYCETALFSFPIRLAWRFVLVCGFRSTEIRSIVYWNLWADHKNGHLFFYSSLFFPSKHSFILFFLSFFLFVYRSLCECLRIVFMYIIKDI